MNMFVKDSLIRFSRILKSYVDSHEKEKIKYRTVIINEFMLTLTKIS